MANITLDPLFINKTWKGLQIADLGGYYLTTATTSDTAPNMNNFGDLLGHNFHFHFCQCCSSVPTSTKLYVPSSIPFSSMQWMPAASSLDLPIQQLQLYPIFLALFIDCQIFSVGAAASHFGSSRITWLEPFLEQYLEF